MVVDRSSVPQRLIGSLERFPPVLQRFRRANVATHANGQQPGQQPDSPAPRRMSSGIWRDSSAGFQIGSLSPLIPLSHKTRP
jgi:hypothetical protein